jgi:hypothetical protein
VKHLSGFLLLLFLVLSCREPLSVEQFIPAPGPYTFQVDMTDTTVAYDFSFYTRLDGTASEMKSARELPLRVSWTSPSDSLFTESVYMPLTGRSSRFTRQVLQPYRTGVRPVEAGMWTLSVAVPYSEGREVLRGLGLVVAERID